MDARDKAAALAEAETNAPAVQKGASPKQDGEEEKLNKDESPQEKSVQIPTNCEEIFGDKEFENMTDAQKIAIKNYVDKTIQERVNQ